ncbi:porin [Ponticaulis sp.]|uniref:OprO/OprP family phosphate-selective porin n=1 Tax=Ponticaulis sp. TaxID=2020902 RepID=UPI0025CEC1F7|nr:porin [Ponticaulis sp.]
MNNKRNLFIATVMFAGLTGAAFADDVDIQLGAHAFLDYENASIAGMDVVDGTNLRLFRIDVKGSVGDYRFASNVDFAGDDVKVKDLYAEFGDNVRVRIGNFKVMNGLEQQSSLYATTFMEAGSVSKLNGISRSLGVGVYTSAGPFNLSAGVFGPDANVLDDTDMYSMSARAAWHTQPMGEDSVLHFAGSVRYRDTNDSGLLSYNQRPFAPSAPKTISASGIGESDVFYGLEAAFLNGGFSAQAEYGHTEISCPSSVCTEDPSSDAYYVDVSYMWGGHRNFSGSLFKRDTVDTPVSQGGMGAFALSGRYDYADLSDTQLSGGEQETFVLGGTWYLDRYVRFMVNLTHSEFEDSPVYGNDDAQSVLFRAQLELY